MFARPTSGTRDRSAPMLPSTSTEVRTCNTQKSDFLKQFYEKEEVLAFQPRGAAHRTGFTFKEHKGKYALVHKRGGGGGGGGGGASGSSSTRPEVTTGYMTDRSDASIPNHPNPQLRSGQMRRAPLETASDVHGEFYTRHTSDLGGLLAQRRALGAAPLTVYEQSLGALACRRQELRDELQNTTAEMAALAAVGSLSARKRALKQEIHGVSGDLAAVQFQKAKKQAHEDKLASLKASKKATLPWQQTSLVMQGDTMTGADITGASAKPSGAFTREFDAPHNNGKAWRVFQGKHGGAMK